MMFAYAVTLEPDEDTLLVSVPALPGIITFGETEAEALEQASDALVTWLHYRMEDDEDIPEPDAKPGALCALVPPRVAMKVLLYQAMRRRGLDKAALMKMLNIGKKQMQQLFDVDHETGTEILESAMAALGRDYDIADAPRRAAAG